jgi:hypothetical protein
MILSVPLTTEVCSRPNRALTFRAFFIVFDSVRSHPFHIRLEKVLGVFALKGWIGALGSGAGEGSDRDVGQGFGEVEGVEVFSISKLPTPTE